MDKIEIGEYVRTKKGIIAKAQLYQDAIYHEGSGKKAIFHNYEADKGIIADIDIAKHSKNIADLIEVGDYVNGERVFKIEKDPFIKGQTDIFFNRDEVDYWGDRSLSQITDKDIKSIVTKEQFNSVMYEVEGEK